MVDPAFDDFFDSDDDEFLLEASNHLIDNDFDLEFTSTKKESVSQSLSTIIPNNIKPIVIPSSDSIESNISNTCKDAEKNTSDVVFPTLSDNCDNKTLNLFENRKEKGTSLDVPVSQKTETDSSLTVNMHESFSKEERIATTSSNCNISTVDVNSFKEFLLEASNHLIDNDFDLEFTSTKKESVSQSLSTIIPNNIKPIVIPSSDSIESNISNTCKDAEKNTSDVVFPTLSDNCDNKTLNLFENRKEKGTSLDVPVSQKTETDSSLTVNMHESFSKEERIATTSSNCNISTVDVNSFKVATPAVPSYINSRFTPGFTPKAKKRKFLGPAGFLDLFDGSKEATTGSPDKILSMDMEFQNIVSSQYTPEHLSLPSWQKLQTTVSSCSNLRSTAKYYSIQRVLSESSKKKLPKHMVVPILCVLLKKLTTKGSAVISIFMDDTGEINGKIDAEVLSKYKELLVEGTALILKKVTFLCNMLILKDQNLVSLYHPQGTEKHPQTLESVLETPEPLKPMNCECMKSSHMKKDALKTPHYDTSKCVTHSQNRLNCISYQSKANNLASKSNNTPKRYQSGFAKPIQNRTKCITNQDNFTNKNINESSESQSMRSDKFLEQLLDEDNCMDDFDEILGNLDEKSFMEDF